MPIFEYQCDTCKAVVEKLIRHNSPPPTSCEEDGCEGSMGKIMSVTAPPELKGGGWASTGYGDSIPVDTGHNE